MAEPNEAGQNRVEVTSLGGDPRPLGAQILWESMWGQAGGTNNIRQQIGERILAGSEYSAVGIGSNYDGNVTIDLPATWGSAAGLAAPATNLTGAVAGINSSSGSWDVEDADIIERTFFACTEMFGWHHSVDEARAHYRWIADTCRAQSTWLIWASVVLGLIYWNIVKASEFLHRGATDLPLPTSVLGTNVPALGLLAHTTGQIAVYVQVFMQVSALAVSIWVYHSTIQPQQGLGWNITAGFVASTDYQSERTVLMMGEGGYYQGGVQALRLANRFVDVPAALVAGLTFVFSAVAVWLVYWLSGKLIQAAASVVT